MAFKQIFNGEIISYKITSALVSNISEKETSFACLQIRELSHQILSLLSELSGLIGYKVGNDVKIQIK